MALRSVVIEPPSPPPAPRRSVVLRPGGPKPKGNRADVLAGVIGLLLLFATVGMAQLLPDTDYVNPRYKLFFPLVGAESTSKTQDLNENDLRSVDIPVPVTTDNVISFVLTVGFEDDIAASDPDVFRVTLFDPQGGQVGQPTNVENPQAPAESGLTGYTYTSIYHQVNINFQVQPAPQEQIAEAAHRAETQKEALDRMAPDYLLPAKGDWTVKIELLEAGDCPDPQGPDFDAVRGSSCLQSRQGNAEDPGNRIILERLQWTYYQVCTETMQNLDPKPFPSCTVP